ncbi:hypothetical protein B0T26DRAFT_7180 [Lasiosphaeria miniovina]|uniref:Uncharacterized protein n=1 Tax=Lasiosphaeria miniovina TaxID=1954250 RepID=A0AA40BFB0_9PEZI|nr:uncharacterized protein B0T26DRAFT_7180 [Lasiosphaeria miniovina]KAK0733201.1 hypothetical protein B0T26DRAFT_7180 [Lasiosphaeria miniovina]
MEALPLDHWAIDSKWGDWRGHRVPPPAHLEMDGSCNWGISTWSRPTALLGQKKGSKRTEPEVTVPRPRRAWDPDVDMVCGGDRVLLDNASSVWNWRDLNNVMPAAEAARQASFSPLFRVGGYRHAAMQPCSHMQDCLSASDVDWATDMQVSCLNFGKANHHWDWAPSLSALPNCAFNAQLHCPMKAPIRRQSCGSTAVSKRD